MVTSAGDDHRLWSARDGAFVRANLPGDVFIDEGHVLGVGALATESMDVGSGARISIPVTRQGALVSPDSRWIAAAREGNVLFFDTLTGDEVDRHPTNASGLLVTPGSPSVFTTIEGTTPTVWSWATRRPVRAIDDRLAPSSDRISDYALSPDGSRACLMGWNSVRVLDLATGATGFTQSVTPIQDTFSSGFVPATVRACAFSGDGARVAFSAIKPMGFRGYAASDEAITVADAKGAVLATFDAVGVDTISLDATGSKLDVNIGGAPDAMARCDAYLVPSGQPTTCTPTPGVSPPTTMGADGVVTLERADGTKLVFDAARGIDPATFSSLSSTHPRLPRATSNPSRIMKAPRACGERPVLARAGGHVLVADTDRPDAIYDCQPAARFPDAMRRLPLGEHRRAEVAMYSEDASVLAIGDSVAAELYWVATLERFAFVPSGGLARVLDGAALFSEQSGVLVAYRWADCSTLRYAPVRDGSARGWVAAVGAEVEADAVGATFLEPGTPTKAGLTRPFFEP